MSLYLGTTLIAPNQPNSANQSLSNINSTAQENIVDLLYPVGSIYIGTTATCPLAAIKGTWTLVSSGRVLQGADNDHAAGTTIEAGLPNITGSFRARGTTTSYNSGVITTATGAMSYTRGGTGTYGVCSIGSTERGTDLVSFDASSSSSIYGNSTTVQPPAYYVNIWERTA